MLHAVSGGGRDVSGRRRIIFGLQEKVPELQLFEFIRLGCVFVLRIDQFQLIPNHLLQGGIGFRAHTDPVQPPGGADRSICFHTNFERQRFQRRNGRFIKLQKGLAACADHVGPTTFWRPGRPDIMNMTGKGIRPLEFSALRAVRSDEIRVAKFTHSRGPVGLKAGPQITSRKSEKNGGTPGLRALALQGHIGLFDTVDFHAARSPFHLR